MNTLNIDSDGVAIKTHFVSADKIDAIISDISQYLTEANNYGTNNYGIRNAEKKFHRVGEMAKSSLFIDLAASILHAQPKIVRVIYFDKTPSQNWLVTWHQDKTVAVTRKVDIPGWGPWSVKDGTHHVQPPVEVLNHMLTLRLHLDHADINNGCLRVIPGSHRLGVLSPSQIAEQIASAPACNCEVNQGDLVVMKPLILHASSKAVTPKHRRVIHIEYCGFDLPSGLAWA